MYGLSTDWPSVPETAYRPDNLQVVSSGSVALNEGRCGAAAFLVGRAVAATLRMSVVAQSRILSVWSRPSSSVASPDLETISG